MSVAQAPLAETLRLGPFPGGLNIRDAYTEIAANELADGTNFTLDERGVAIKRNDCPANATFAVPPGAVTAFFFSSAINYAIIQVGTTLYRSTNLGGGGGWTSFKVLSTVSVCAFADFANKLVFTHAADGTFTYDGTTLTLVAATRNGTCIAAWQNKVWVGGVPSATGSRYRVGWCAAGDATTWAATDFVDLREKDDQPMTALFGGSGLIAFKESSLYRINDSTTGAFSTIDWNSGCVGALAVCGSDEGIFHWGLDGLYRSSGIGPSVLIGDKLRPRFLSANINATTKPMIAGVYLNGRVYFAFPRANAFSTDAIMEYNPRTGWLMEPFFSGAQVGPFVKYAVAGVWQASFASASATIKDLFTGTTRTGFSCSLTTGYLEPFGGKLARVLRLRPELTLPAAAPIVCGLNYTDASGAPQVLTFPSTTFTSAGTQRPNFWPASVGRAFQVFLNDTATPLASLSVLQAAIDAIDLER